MMMRIDKIWNELESDNTAGSGLLLRLYSIGTSAETHIAFRLSDRVRCIAVRLSAGTDVDVSKFDSLKDISLAVVTDETDAGRKYLLVILESSQHKDVFSVLCENLIGGIAKADTHDKAVKQLFNRLGKWRSLFEKAILSGLSPEEQCGLYGEIFFLRKWLTVVVEKEYCIEAWQGPEKELRDFQLGNWALEVKTTWGNNHQKITVSSERQLDTSQLANLFLYHLSTERQRLNGETLNQLVVAVNDLLEEEQSAQALFNAKLLHAGYFPQHHALYEQFGYQVRKESYYTVRDDFPRIEENDIRKGVGDVKYSILLPDYVQYLTESSVIFETINHYGDSNT